LYVKVRTFPHNISKEDTSSVAVCAKHCSRCDVNGMGKCDPEFCELHYGFSTTTETCLGELLFWGGTI